MEDVKPIMINVEEVIRRIDYKLSRLCIDFYRSEDPEKYIALASKTVVLNELKEDMKNIISAAKRARFEGVLK